MDPKQIEPTSKQRPFIETDARYACMSGGYGCVAGETKVFDPTIGKKVRIDELNQGHVYSKQFKGYGINWATRPKKYKKTRLYKVKTERGNEIIVTKKHKFFSQDDWKTLSSLKTGQSLLVYGGLHPLTILGIFPSILLSGVWSFWKKVQGFLWNCFSYYRLCDERLLWVKAISLVYPPSQADAVLRNLLSSRRDDLELRRERSHLYQLEYLLSKNHSENQSDLPVANVEDYIFGQSSELLFSTYPLWVQSLLNKGLLHKVVLFFLKLQGMFWTWYYNHTLRYEKVKSIKYERTDYYYDLHVPHFNNYFAEGFVNHNSGKTFGGCLRALLLSSIPGNRGLVGRLTYRELADTTRKTFFELCPPEYYDEKNAGRWSPTENNLTLINGSEIFFRHLDTVSEAELKSMNLGWFFIDQAEEISLNVVRVLQSRLRLNSVPRRFGFFTCNPEPGSWIEEMFKRPYDEGKLKPEFFYLDTTTYDNPYNPPDYVADLIRQYPPELAKRYIEGRWDVLANLIYTELDPKVHVIRPFTVPKSWEHIVSVDHGMVNPTGVLWAALDYDSNIYIFDEYYSPGVVSEHARAIKEKTGDRNVSLWLIDPSTKAKTREKKDAYGNAFPWSIIEEYEDYGFYFIPANNEKLAGINRVKEFLKLDDRRINPQTRKKPAPRLYIMQNCVNLIWELKQYKWRKLRSMTNRNAPEEPVDFADHLVDSLRYIIMSRFPTPSKTPDGKLMITRLDRENANFMSTNQPVVADEVLGQYGSSNDDYEAE